MYAPTVENARAQHRHSRKDGEHTYCYCAAGVRLGRPEWPISKSVEKECAQFLILVSLKRVGDGVVHFEFF